MENAGGGSCCGGSGRSLSSVACSKLGGSSSKAAVPFGSEGSSWASGCFLLGRLSIIISWMSGRKLIPGRSIPHGTAVCEIRIESRGTVSADDIHIGMRG